MNRLVFILFSVQTFIKLRITNNRLWGKKKILHLTNLPYEQKTKIRI